MLPIIKNIKARGIKIYFKVSPIYFMRVFSLLIKGVLYYIISLSFEEVEEYYINYFYRELVFGEN